MNADIGHRVRERIRQARPGAAERSVAAEIGMPPDAFSRALNGKRGFAAIELALLAELLGADLHWLITGTDDPFAMRIAARHTFDCEVMRHDVPGRDADEATLADIGLAYRQAYPAAVPQRRLPATVTGVREALGPDFVRPFADRVESKLGVDVIRIAELSTAYSVTIGGRLLITVPAAGSWFRENWSIAHELGHLVLGHHDSGDENWAVEHEPEADAFAAALLLPEDMLDAIKWDDLSDRRYAEFVWQTGVSTTALFTRLKALMDRPPVVAQTWSTATTQKLLRRHLPRSSAFDEITDRMNAAARRRFPLSLQQTHLDRISTGELHKNTYAWMLGVTADSIDVDEPEIDQTDVDTLAADLGLSMKI